MQFAPRLICAPQRNRIASMIRKPRSQRRPNSVPPLRNCPSTLKINKAPPMKHHRPIEDPFLLLPRALTKLNSLWRRSFYPFASIGRRVSFHFTSRVCRSRASRVSLGNLVSLREFAWLSVATEDPAGDPVIVIEDGCTIGFACVI